MMNELILATVQTAVYGNTTNATPVVGGSTATNASIFITVVTGVIVFVLGRFIEKFVIDPWKDQKVAIGLVLEMLMTEARIYLNPIKGPTCEAEFKVFDDSKKQIRSATIKLVSSTYAITFYWFVAKITGRPDLMAIREANDLMIDLSNNLSNVTTDIESAKSKNRNYRNEIIRLLKIHKFIDQLDKAKKTKDK